MEFKLKFSANLVADIFFTLAALLTACLGFFSPVFKNGFLHYGYIIWLILVIVKFLTFRNYIFLGLSDKPVLALNENYIYDIPNDRKFYWKDVKEITKKNNYYLTVQLHDPSSYLSCFHTKLQRWWAKRRIEKGKSPYLINIDLVDTGDGDLLAVLNDYKADMR